MLILEEQGCSIKDNTIFKYNNSATLTKKHGRNSCTGDSGNISVWYFFIKDNIDKFKLKVKYCPTHQIFADHPTEPLIGETFYESRNVIMGYKSIFDLNSSILH